MTKKNNITALCLIAGFAALIAAFAALAEFASEDDGNEASDGGRDEYITNKFDPRYRYFDKTRFRSQGDFEASLANLQLSDRTPRWTPDSEIVIVNIGSAIYGASTAGDLLWRIPEEPIQEQFAPVVRSDGLVAYLNYEYHRDTNSHVRRIETAQPDGTGRRRLARLPGSDWHTRASSPSWSPDGRFIGVAMSSSEVVEGKEVGGLHVISPDGTFTRLEALFYSLDYGLHWSPDGKRLATLVRHGGPVQGRWDADEVSVSWDAPEPLEAREFLSHLAWAPTSDRIYYAASGGSRDEPAEIGAELMVMDVSTQEKRSVADIRPERVIHAVQVSPDGQRILLTSATITGYHPVQIMNIDGSETEDLCCDFGIRSGKGGYLWASWSPDGERVAVLDLYPSHEVALRTMRPDGSDEKVLIRRNEDGTLAPGQPR